HPCAASCTTVGGLIWSTRNLGTGSRAAASRRVPNHRPVSLHSNGRWRPHSTDGDGVPAPLCPCGPPESCASVDGVGATSVGRSNSRKQARTPGAYTPNAQQAQRRPSSSTEDRGGSRDRVSP